MSDERPVSFKKFKKDSCADCSSSRSSSKTCIVHFNECTESEVKDLSEDTYHTIIERKVKRQSLQNPAHRLDDICVQIPVEYDGDSQGFHRFCFTKFVNVSRYKNKEPANIEQPSCSTSNHRTSFRLSSSGITEGLLFPQDKCLFCGKARRQRRGKEEGLSTCVTKSAEENIKRCAKARADFVLQNISTEEEPTLIYGSKEHKAAHDDAFEYIVRYVTEEIINGGIVLRMTMLKEKYLSYIQEHTPEFYNPNYTTFKLKSKLCSLFGEKLEFWQPNYRSDLVFSKGLRTGEAVEMAFESATSESKILSHLLR